MADDASANTQADGYYAEDNMGDEELDLSFLDDDKDDDKSETPTPDKK